MRSIEKWNLTKRSLTNSFLFRNVSLIKVIKGLRIFPSLIRVPSEQCSKYLFKEKKNLHTWLVDEGHLQNFIICAKFAFDHLQK